MFGATPGLFKNREAAILAAKAFSLEEKTEWVVVKKKPDHHKFTYFRPCEATDVEHAEEEGWTAGVIFPNNL